MKKYQPLALILGTMMAAGHSVPASAKDISCKVGKQNYSFKALSGKKVTNQNLKSQTNQGGGSYTEVEWTYLKKVAPQLATKSAIRCGSKAFLKLDDIRKLKDNNLKINSSIFIKIDID